MPTEQPKDVVDSGFANNPVHRLRQELLGYNVHLTQNPQQAIAMRPKLIEAIREVGGLLVFKNVLVEFARDGFNIGTFEELGIADWSWVPDDLR
jgi:hypothetical protein